MKTQPAWRLHTLVWIKMNRKCNIYILFIYTMGNTNGSTLDTTSVDTSTASQHTSIKELAREGWRYNRDVRGYYNVRLRNGKRFLSKSLFFYNGFTIGFNMIIYCFKQVGHDYFSFHLEILIRYCSHVSSCRPLLVWCFLCL